MDDVALPTQRAISSAASVARTHGLAGICRRIRGGIRMHHLLFIVFTVVAAVPTAVLAVWEDKTAYDHELDSVRERHLLVARNLTSTMSRYVRDVKAAFTVVFESNTINKPIPGLADLLTSLDFVNVCIVTPDGTIESRLRDLTPPGGAVIETQLFGRLKALAASGRGLPVLSNLEHSSNGRPVFYLVTELPYRRLGLGILSTDYLISLQKAIAFGDRGHAVITDAKGHVIAHPLKDWVAASQDISGVPVVAAMMQGQSGVGQFYSPAFGGYMVAGFAVVPETGWGVMIPQPLSELQRRAGQVASMVIVVAGLTFAAAAFLSWVIALYLSRPLRQVAQTAEAVLAGSESVSAPNYAEQMPLEIRQLCHAFNTMLADLQHRSMEIRLALRQAEASSLATTQFLTNMSHEIRTPLNGVIGTIELLRLSDLSPTQQRFIDDAMQSSQALLHLVNDILDLSKIEAGKLELEHAPFYLPSLIHDVRAMFSDQAHAKELTLTASIAAEFNVVLLGDAHRLLQVLTNLVGNAVKFTGEGTVTIAVTCLEDRGDALHLRFTVTDTGIGIPCDKHSTIFEAFSQADSSTTRRYGGTGLGLSIARQLCHVMGGEIGVNSELGQGSTFWFNLVLERQHATVALPTCIAHTKATQSELLQTGGGSGASAARQELRETLCRKERSTIRILLVEDNRANLRITQALLEAIGCNVTAASNGLEAISACRDTKFDLILMDCQMPEMDGYEATRRIREIEAVRTTPIVALTADALEGSRELSLAAGMNDQLTKPLTLRVLTVKLDLWLGGSSVEKGQEPRFGRLNVA
jgi:signal transduction histidine kinase